MGHAKHNPSQDIEDRVNDLADVNYPLGVTLVR